MEEHTDRKTPTTEIQNGEKETKPTKKQQQQKTKPKQSSKKPNPYQNTDMAAIKLLRRRQRVTRKKVPVASAEGASEGQENAHPPATPTGDTPRGNKGDEQGGQTLEEPGVREPGQGNAGDNTGRTSTLPPVDEFRGGKVGIRQRYTSASLKSLYLREDEKRRSKGSAGTRKSNSLVFEVGGGSLMTYTGVYRMKKDCLSATTKRLAQYEPEKGVPDARRTVGPEVVGKCGLTASFQWTAGGQRCHGFMW